MFWIKTVVAILCAAYLFSGVTMLCNAVKNSYRVNKRHLMAFPKVKTGLIEMFSYGVAFIVLAIPLSEMLAGNYRFDPVTIGVDIYLAYVAARFKVLV